jgi:hypothetical protein
MLGVTALHAIPLDSTALDSTSRRTQAFAVLRAGFIAGLCGGIVAALIAAVYSPARLAARARQARAVAATR